jgi:hypothetical protein
MTEESYWDRQVRRALAPALGRGELRIVDDADALFGRLQSAYPVQGTKIDWSEVPGSFSLNSQGSKQADFEEFFRENAPRMGLDTPAYYLSDSALSFAIAGSVRCIDQELRAILDNPEHHYFTAEDFSWCMALTMEGDMDFGFRP